MVLTRQLKTQLMALAFQAITGQLKDLEALITTLNILLEAAELELENQRRKQGGN